MLRSEQTTGGELAIRSWLYAPGHSQKLLERVFTVGADAVVLDLEDGVPAVDKPRARIQVAAAIAERAAWVRINAAPSDAAAADLGAVAEHARGIRVPKAESAAGVAWVAERAPGVPLTASIETARGVLAAAEIATVPAVRYVSVGIADLSLDLGVAPSSETIAHARSQLVLAARAAGIAAPIDGVYSGPDDETALAHEACRSRDAGLFGKSVVRPWQVPVVNAVFSPNAAGLEWATRVVDAFERSAGKPTRLDDGEFIDLPIAERARRLLRSAG